MNLRKKGICVVVFLSTLCLLTFETSAHEWMAPKAAAAVKNPIKADTRTIEKGKKSYIQNCVSCHGENLEGLPADEVGLEMSPPDLKKRIRTHSDGDFFWKIQEGRGDMPSFKDDLSEDEIWSVIHYIRLSDQEE